MSKNKKKKHQQSEAGAEGAKKEIIPISTSRFQHFNISAYQVMLRSTIHAPMLLSITPLLLLL